LLQVLPLLLPLVELAQRPMQPALQVLLLLLPVVVPAAH